MAHAAKKPRLDLLTDDRGYNLLMLAAEQNRIDLIVPLIDTKQFDVNHKVGTISAMELAWNLPNYDIVLKLLQNNALFPSNLYTRMRLQTTEQLQAFVATTIRLHELIESHLRPQNNLAEISQIVDANPHLRHFFNLGNHSAAFVALKAQKLDLYDLLGSKNVVIAQTDPAQEIKAILEGFTPNLKNEVKKIHEKLARDVSKKHLQRLLLNSFVGADDIKAENRFDLVWDAFEVLDKEKLIQPILELISWERNFKIFL